MTLDEKKELFAHRNKIHALFTNLSKRGLIGNWNWTEDWVHPGFSKKNFNHRLKVSVFTIDNKKETIIINKEYECKEYRFHIFDQLPFDLIAEDYLKISEEVLKLTGYKNMLKMPLN